MDVYHSNYVVLFEVMMKGTEQTFTLANRFLKLSYDMSRRNKGLKRCRKKRGAYRLG